MSGICSAHRHNQPDCAACQAHPRDIFPDWDAAVARAEAAGQFECICGFIYYLTVTACPLCNRELKGKKL